MTHSHSPIEHKLSFIVPSGIDPKDVILCIREGLYLDYEEIMNSLLFGGVLTKLVEPVKCNNNCKKCNGSGNMDGSPCNNIKIKLYPYITSFPDDNVDEFLIGVDNKYFNGIAYYVINKYKGDYYLAKRFVRDCVYVLLINENIVDVFQEESDAEKYLDNCLKNELKFYYSGEEYTGNKIREIMSGHNYHWNIEKLEIK